MKRSNWRLSAILWFKRRGTVALLAAAGIGALPAQTRADVIGIGDITPSQIDPETGETIPNLPRFGGTVTSGTIIVGGTGTNVGGTAAGQMTIDIPADTDPLVSENGIIGGNRFGLGLVRIASLNSEWRITDTLIIADEGQGFLQIVSGGRLGTGPGVGGGGGLNDYDLILGNQEGSQGFATIDGFASLMVNSNISIGYESFGDLRLTNGARLETLQIASIGTEMDLGGSNNILGQGYVLVDGIGTRWNVGFVEPGQAAPESWDFFIGEEGRGVLEITNQGRVQVADDTYLGSEGGAHGELTVTGRNSIIWTREEMFIGSETVAVPPALPVYGTGIVNINDNGIVRNDQATTIYRLGTINLNGGTLLTPLVTNVDGVIRGAGTVDAVSVINDGDIRNAASTINPNLRERLLFTGAVTNNDNIESVGGEMEFKGNVVNGAANGDIYGKDAIFRFLGANGLVNNGRLTLDNTIVESTIVTNNASMAVQADASSTIFGDLTLTSTSILEMDLGDDHSELWVTGTADLGGILSLSLKPNYVPQLGDSFEILRSDTLAGSTFDAVVSPGTQWNVTYPGDSVYVTFAGVAVPGVGADFNGDGVVDGDDLAVWKLNFGTGSNPPPLATQAQGDANGDGKVDGADWMIIQRQFGGPPIAIPASGGSIVGVPEPNSLVLAAAVFGLPLTARRRRK